jgi:small conductance mechanosensitive channel
MNWDFSAALETLDAMGDNLIRLLPNIVVAVLIFLFFYFLGWIMRTIVRRLSARYRRNFNLAKVLGRLTQFIVVLLGLLVALVIIFPTFSPAQLIQLLGLGSVAIGFAFRDILENFLAGILLLLTEPFRIGDQIVLEGVEGTVEDIETRATTILTYDGRRVVVPNARIFTNIVTVNTAFTRRRMEQDLGFRPDQDLQQVKVLIVRAMEEAEGVLADPAPSVLIVGLEGYRVVLRARWWFAPPLRSDALHIRDQVLDRIHARLQANGIEIVTPLPGASLVDLQGDKSRGEPGDG